MSAPVRLRRTLKVQPKIGPTQVARNTRNEEQSSIAVLTHEASNQINEIEVQNKNDEKLPKDSTTETIAHEIPLVEVELQKTNTQQPSIQMVQSTEMQVSKSQESNPHEDIDDDKQSVSSSTNHTSITSSESQHSFTIQDPNYKSKYTREHIEYVLRQKSLKKLKESERQEHKEKRRSYRQIVIDTENIDRSKMRMRDLLYYIPKGNQMRSTLGDVIDENTSNTQNTNESNSEVLIQKVNLAKPSSAELNAPQLKFAEDGSIILNEESLIVTRVEETIVFDKTIVEGEANDSLSYKSYRKIHHTKKWSKQETIKFYKALRMVGTDFTMVQKLFPNRTRDEVKRKFKREERINQSLMDCILSRTDKIDLAVFFCSEEEKEDSEIEKKPKKKLAKKRIEKEKVAYNRYDPIRKRKRNFIESDDDDDANTSEVGINSSKEFVDNNKTSQETVDIVCQTLEPLIVFQAPEPVISQTNNENEEFELIYDLDNDTIEIADHNNTNSKSYYNL